MTARELSGRIVAGELSVTEAVQEALDRAHRDHHGAFVHIAEEYALDSAAHLQRRLADPSFVPGPLFGVPCPIKDLNQVAGMPYEAGSAALRGHKGGADDGVVVRLREAGTVNIGKTATPEFGLPCYTEPEGHAPATTPWDATRTAGGSSGGPAAAVASGVVPIAQGNDGGGSIRIPASCCGLVGLKVSRGRIGRGPLVPDGPGLAVEGVLTTDVRDTAAALDALAGPWPGDTYLAPRSGSFLEAAETPSRNLRVGVLTEPVITEDAAVHPAAVRAVERTAALLTELGHRVEQAPVPFPAARWQAFQAVWAVGALAVPLPPEREELLRPLTRWLREQGRSISGEQHAAALAAIQDVTRETARTWADYDLILTPTLAQPPAKVGELRNDADPAEDFAAQTRFTPWTSLYTLTGRPAISLPLWTEVVDGTELPIGVMLGAPIFEEARLLSVACALEAAAR